MSESESTTSSKTCEDTQHPNQEKQWLLGEINTPADLRKLPLSLLPQVCSDIRNFLIDSLSKNPGHFASSMGAVELTVALHYVFNTPYDRIVWDVGHQAYGHKLITGRRDRFDTNRTLGGLSGFPNPEESEYDTFIAGHASNSISAALGMAVASATKKDEPRRNVVAVIGDASISGGLAFEGINNAANTPNNLLIILNDNDMSIDANVGSLHTYLARITTSKKYNRLRFNLYQAMRKAGLVSDRGKGFILRFNNSIKSLLGHEQNIFEGLNIRYFGPVDGHDINQLVKVLSDIKDMEGPRILHIKTKKGKGFAPAESDPATWHAPGKFDPATGRRSSAKFDTPQPPKYQHVFGTTLLELAQKNDRIIGITAAMAPGTSMNIMKDAMPNRVFDVGISEGHAVTFAAGLAKEGLLPVVAIYSSFLQRGYDQIIHDVAIQKLPVIFCIDRAGLVGEDGVTHHGLLDLAYLRTVPGMVVASPRNEEDLRNMMFTATTEAKGPYAIRYPRGSGEMVDWKTPMHRIDTGKGVKLAEGTDAALLTIGPIAHEASKAVALLAREGINAAHYDMRFAKPIDTDILAEVATMRCPVITVEDGTTVGGMGSAVAEWMAKNAPGVKVVSLGVDDQFVGQGTVSQLKALCGIDTHGITESVMKVVGKNSNKEAAPAAEHTQPVTIQHE